MACILVCEVPNERSIRGYLHHHFLRRPDDHRWGGLLRVEGLEGRHSTLVIFLGLLCAMMAAAAPPVCVPAATSTLFSGSPKIGFPTGTGYSVAANCTGTGGSITYLWTQTAGTNTLVLATATTSTVGVTGNNAFSTITDVLNVRATDSNGTSNTTISIGTYGGVDANGVITDFTPALGSTNGPLFLKILGPICGYGAACQQEPWYDDRDVYMAAQQIANGVPGSYYAGYWNTPQAGTCTVTGGSTTVTCVGSSFRAGVGAAPCDAGGLAISGALFWWAYTGSDGLQHYTGHGVASCASNTVLTLTEAYPLNSVITGGSYTLANCDTPCSGLTWGYYTDGAGGNAAQGYAGAWNYSPGPANYYDNVVGFYTLGIRTGQDIYLAKAKALADLWWQSPAIDQGNSCHFGGAWQACYNGTRQSFSMLGVILRALDGKPGYFTGLRTAMWPTFIIYTTSYINGGYVDDVRGESYMIDYTAACAIVEPDMTQRTTCKDALRTGVTQTNNWSNLQQADGSYVSYYSNGNTSVGNATTITMSGTTATLSGATCPTGTWYLWTWVTAPGTQPASVTSSGADGIYYTALCNGTGVATISPTYAGAAGGGKGYSFSQTCVGWCTQPFMNGLMGTAMGLAAVALDDGAHDTYRDTYKTIANNLGTFLATTGRSTRTGLQYFYTPLCGAPPPTSDEMCNLASSFNVQQMRSLSAEATMPLMQSWARTGTLSYKTASLTLNAEMYCKASTNCLQSTTVDYLTDLNPGGQYVSGTPPTGMWPKWFGEFMGFTEGDIAQPALTPMISSAPSFHGNISIRGAIH